MKVSKTRAKQSQRNSRALKTAPAPSGSHDEREYDFAISYAGEDSRVATRLANLLHQEGFAVFYAKHAQGKILGKNATFYEHVYGPAARYVIPLLSEHYRRKEWCQFEFDVASEEAKSRDDEFILPVRLDDTRQPNLMPDCQYADYRTKSIPTIVREFKEKIDEAENNRSPRSNRRVRLGKLSRTPVILSESQRDMLGLFATCALPVDLSAFKRIFPGHDKNDFAILRQNRLLVGEGQNLQVLPSAAKTILGNPSDRSRFDEQWVTALSPLAGHTDTALALSIHLTRLGSHEAAVKVLTEVAIALDSGFWNSLYLDILQVVHERVPQRKLTPSTRAELLNALGVCSCKAGRNEEGIRYLTDLRRYAKRNGNTWAQANALINRGVALYNLGRFPEAERMYKQAARFAEKVGERVVLARSLSNLSQLLMSKNPGDARLLLERSVELKKEIGDSQGLVGSYLALGNFHVRIGDLATAKQWYERAGTKSHELDLRYEECLALINLANTDIELGNSKNALKLYTEGERIAEKEGFKDAVTLSLRNRAALYSTLRQFKKSEHLFRRLESEARKSRDRQQQAIALHDIGAVLINSGKWREGRATLEEAVKLLQPLEEPTLLYQCHLTLGCSYLSEVKIASAMSSFSKSARALARRDSAEAALLLVNAAELVTQHSGFEKEVLGLYKLAYSYLSSSKRVDLDSLRLQAICCGMLGDNSSERRCWERCRVLAAKQSNAPMAFEALSALARILFQAWDYDSALKHARDAVSYASMPTEEIDGLSLTMDALLATRRTKEASKVFSKACRICRKYDLRAQAVDLHMKLGDYYWGLRSSTRYAAMKAYIAGLSESLGMDIDALFKVGSHVVVRLYCLRVAPQAASVQKLCDRIVAWLQETVSKRGDEDRVAQWLQWPLRVALALPIHLDDPSSIAAEEIQTGLLSEVNTWGTGTL